MARGHRGHLCDGSITKQRDNPVVFIKDRLRTPTLREEYSTETPQQGEAEDGWHGFDSDSQTYIWSSLKGLFLGRALICKLPLLERWWIWLRMQWKVTRTRLISDGITGLMHCLPGPSLSITIVYSTHPQWTTTEALAEERNEETKVLILRLMNGDRRMKCE